MYFAWLYLPRDNDFEAFWLFRVEDNPDCFTRLHLCMRLIVVPYENPLTVRDSEVDADDRALPATF